MTAPVTGLPVGPSPYPTPYPAPVPATAPPILPGPDAGGDVLATPRRRRLRGPRHDPQLVTDDQLAALALPVSDDGVVMGVDTAGHPAVLGLFRPRPFDVVIIGGAYVVRVLALRAAAVGARVAVESGRPDLWAPLAHSAGGGQPCVTVHQVGGLGPQGPSAAGPVLVVRDCGARPPRDRLAPTPWQTTVTLLPFLDPRQTRRLATADLVGLQRLSPAEAEAASTALTLSPADREAIPTLSDEITLWCRQREAAYVLLTPTQAEGGLLGPPSRMD